MTLTVGRIDLEPESVRIDAHGPAMFTPRCDLCAYAGVPQPSWARAVKALSQHAHTDWHGRAVRRASISPSPSRPRPLSLEHAAAPVPLPERGGISSIVEADLDRHSLDRRRGRAPGRGGLSSPGAIPCS